MAQQDKSFEGAWRSAFGHKSITPPAGAWENIEKELDERSSKSVIPLLWRTAAAVSFLAITIFIVQQAYTVKEQNQIRLATEEKPENEGLINEYTKKEALAIEPGIISDKSEETGEKENSIKEKATYKNKNEGFTTSSLGTPVKENINTVADLTSDEQHISLFDKIVRYLSLESSEYLAHLPAVEFQIEIPETKEIWGVPVYYDSKKRSSNEWFAGVDFSAGSSGSDYSSMYSSDRDLASADNNGNLSPQHFSESETGSTVSYGISIGKKISRKVIIEGGIDYRIIEKSSYSNLTYNLDGSRLVYNESLSYSTNGQLATTSVYEMENVHQFISIPLKAAYLFIDRKWKMSIGTGFSGDYFFQTSSVDVSGNYSSYKANPSENPIWNSFNISLLGEINLTRQIGEHYNLSLSPQLRQALTDYSNSSRQELKPAIIQLGIKLKYNF